MIARILFAVVLAVGIAHADCDPSVLDAGPLTRLGLYHPNHDFCGWDAQLNLNWEFLDAYACATGHSCSLTLTDTFDASGTTRSMPFRMGGQLNTPWTCTWPEFYFDTTNYLLLKCVQSDSKFHPVWPGYGSQAYQSEAGPAGILIHYEGTTVDGNYFRVQVPTDPAKIYRWIQPTCAANCDMTFPNAGGTLARTSGDTFTSSTFTSPTINTPTETSPTINTGVSAGTGLKHGRVTTGSINASTSAAVTLTWGGSAFANTSYTVTCDVLEATTSLNTLHVHHIESQTTTTVVVRVNNDDAGGAHTGTLHCIAMHD